MADGDGCAMAQLRHMDLGLLYHFCAFLLVASPQSPGNSSHYWFVNSLAPRDVDASGECTLHARPLRVSSLLPGRIRGLRQQNHTVGEGQNPFAGMHSVGVEGFQAEVESLRNASPMHSAHVHEPIPLPPLLLRFAKPTRFDPPAA